MDFKKRIVLTSIVSGVLPATYLLVNYSNSEKLKSKGVPITLFWGFVLSLISYFCGLLLFETFMVPLKVHTLVPVVKYGIAYALLVLVQSCITTGFVYAYQRHYGKDVFTSNANFKSLWNGLNFLAYFLLGLGITAFLFGSAVFVFTALSIYLIPNVYLYRHLKTLLYSKKGRWLFKLLFIGLVLMFPAAISLSSHLEINGVKVITYIGNYYAILLLYMVLFYLLSDGVKLLSGKLFKVVPKIYSKPKFIFGICFTLALLVEVYGVLNFNIPRVSSYKIEFARKYSSRKNLKIVMAADFHFSEITSKKFVSRFVRKVNSLNADVVLFAGDIFESNKSNAELDFIKGELSKIQSKYGVYAAEGNHGYYRGTNTQEFFDEANVTLLRDTIVVIDNAFQLLGRMDRHNKERKPLSQLLAKANSGLPLITIDHQPYYEEVGKAGDVYLSGHTHNGQLFPFNFIVKQVFEIPWGYRKINDTHFFITSGAQGWGPQVKTAGISEIMEIEIELWEN